MPIDLKSRNYAEGLKWSLLPRNKIDTVSMKPLLNNETTTSLIHTFEITNVVLNGANMTLPVSADAYNNKIGFMCNQNKDNNKFYAWANILSSVITGTVTLTLQAPLPMAPTVAIRLEGLTQYINKGVLTLDTLWPIQAEQLGSYIVTNKSGEEAFVNSKSQDTVNRASYTDKTLVDYASGVIPLYAFVRTYDPNEIAGVLHPRVTEDKILTDWRQGQDSTLFRTTAKYGDWLATPGGDSIGLYGNVILDSTIADQRILIRKRSINITAKATKIDDYNYSIDYEVPIRYVYAAACIYSGLFGGEHNADSYAFIDLVSKIYIDVYANTLDENSTNISYSLDSNGNLTEEIINENILTFDKDTLITIGATWNSTVWTQAMSKYILEEYKNGKHTITVDISGTWAISNGVTINSQFYVYLQDGSRVCKNNTPVIFEVKNITKKFLAAEFTYELKLLEV